MKEYLEYVKQSINNILKNVLGKNIEIINYNVADDWFDIQTNHDGELPLSTINKINELIYLDVHIKNWRFAYLNADLKKHKFYYYLYNVNVKKDCTNYIIQVRNNNLKDLING